MSSANWLLSHGYGICAELDGFVLLRANYSGPLVRYSPLVESLPASEFWMPSRGAEPANAPANASFYGPYDELFSVDFAGLSYGIRPEWYGPYLALPPGKFNVTFFVKGVKGGEAQFFASAENGTVPLSSTGVVLGGGWQEVTLTVDAQAFYGWVGLGCSASGAPVSVRWVEVKQVASSIQA